MRVLGIESSCDELAMAILEPDGRSLAASIVHSQTDLHARFGGIVPEVASRDHVRRLDAMFAATVAEAGFEASEAFDAVAVTAGPGLVGSLLCGLEFAKGLALGSDKPFLGVHHLEGHLASALLESGGALPHPWTALLVSGGHTLLLDVEGPTGPYVRRGGTRDDAAGEAFDKTAKLLGLGYPGGARIDAAARTGDPEAFAFPAMMPGKDNLDFSFSGLKTHVKRWVTTHGVPRDPQRRADFCASFQQAVVDNLLDKAFRAARVTGRLVLAGGVAANSGLRRQAQRRGAELGIEVHLPSRAFCTDNAAMIARAGWTRLRRGERSDWREDARARWDLFQLPS